MRPATSPESAADPIARAVANRAGAVLDPHDRATLEHAARGGLADAIARAHAAVAAQRTAVRPQVAQRLTVKPGQGGQGGQGTFG